MNLTSDVRNVQDPDIAVTGNGNIYVTIGQGATINGQQDAIIVARSTDCGRTFGKPGVVTTYIPYNAQDVSAPQPVPVQSAPDDPQLEEEAAGNARDCGDFADACKSGYTLLQRHFPPLHRRSER